MWRRERHILKNSPLVIFSFLTFAAHWFRYRLFRYLIKRESGVIPELSRSCKL